MLRLQEEGLPRTTRPLELLAEYDLKVKYRPWTENQAADNLPRFPVGDPPALRYKEEHFKCHLGVGKSPGLFQNLDRKLAKVGRHLLGFHIQEEGSKVRLLEFRTSKASVVWSG